MNPSEPGAWDDGAPPVLPDAAARAAWAGEAAARLGGEFRARGSVVEHVPSGLAFAVVPGGTSIRGASAADQASFDDAAFLDDPCHQERVASGELDLLRQATLASVPAVRTFLAPFLLAVEPMTRAQAEALGFGLGPSGAPRIFGARAEDPLYLLPGELDSAPSPLGLRLPTEEEWEHACRLGGSGPFRWGAEVPSEPVDPPHPLGLRLLGWHRERCAVGDPRPGGEGAGPAWEGVARGGAAALHPWQGGCAEWTLLLPWRRVRLSDDPVDGQHAVRWALDLPGSTRDARPPEPLDEAIVPTRPSREALALRSALESGEPAAVDEGLAGATRLADRGRWSAQVVHLLPALVSALSRADDGALPRGARALAEVSAGDPHAFSATGLDPDRPGWRAACSTNAARAVRASLGALAPEVAGWLSRPSAVRRAHAAFLLPLLAPGSAEALDALSAALASETDELALLGEAIAHGLIARRAGRRSAPPPFRCGGPLAEVASALAGLSVGELPGAADLDRLAAAALRSPFDAQLLPWREGRLDVLIAFHLDQHDPRPLAAARFLARLSREAGPAHPLAASHASGALALGFRGRRVAGAGSLSEAERAVLLELSASDLDSPRVAAAFHALGVPADAASRRSWLGS